MSQQVIIGGGGGGSVNMRKGHQIWNLSGKKMHHFENIVTPASPYCAACIEWQHSPPDEQNRLALDNMKQ